jgi:hypothetical protein
VDYLYGRQSAGPIKSNGIPERTRMKQTDRGKGYWPVGIHLRFKLDAAVQPQYESLRGTPVLVLSRPQPTSLPDDHRPAIVRQEVFSYALGRMGAALPSQLERIPDRRHAPPQRSDQRVEE